MSNKIKISSNFWKKEECCCKCQGRKGLVREWNSDLISQSIPLTLRQKALQPLLLLGQVKTCKQDTKVTVRGGKNTVQVYVIRQLDLAIYKQYLGHQQSYCFLLLKIHMKLKREKSKTYYYNMIEYFWLPIQEDASQENLVAKVIEPQNKRVIDEKFNMMLLMFDRVQLNLFYLVVVIQSIFLGLIHILRESNRKLTKQTSLMNPFNIQKILYSLRKKEERKICSKNQLEITTIDLKQSTAKENKYLCIKCLIENFDVQNMAYVDETKIMIKEMKNEQQAIKIKGNKERIEHLKQIESLITIQSIT